MPELAQLIRRIRPAPLGSAVANICGLSKRRVIDTTRGKFMVSPMSHLGYQLAHGGYEPEMTAAIGRHLKPGDVFVDLGANEGYFSVIASPLVGSRGKVIAVEPQSRLQATIDANLALNGCTNVKVFSLIVADTTGTMRLHLTRGANTGGSSLFRPTKYALPTEEVQSFTLADFLSKVGIDTCDLLKVDIEGAEYEVFMNAEEVLRAGAIRNIALEIHDSILARRGLSGEALHRWILSCGYTLRDEGPVRVYSWTPKH
jgi:FkbM family methyltransferase